MQNKRGNVAVIVIIIVIVAITAGVIGWMFAKKTQAPSQQTVVNKPIAPIQQQPAVQPATPATQPVAQPAQKDSILDEKMKNEIVNWSNYKKFENIKFPVLGIEECNSDKEKVAYELFIKKANQDIEKFEFAKFGNRYGIDLYITPNYDKVENFKSGCSGGLGGIYPVATYKDYIVWGWLSCSGGWAPDPSDPSYNDFNKCEKMADELKNYFKLD